MDNHIRITPKPRVFSPGELWRSRDLIGLLTRRSILLGYKQTVLGPMWILVQPLLTAVVYGFLFGGVAGLSTGGAPQLPFYLCGTALWSFFSGCVTKNALCFRENANLFGKVWFPRLAVPMANLMSAGVTLTIQLALVAVLGAESWGGLLRIPAAVLQLGLLGVGTGLMISALTVRYRDLHVLVGFGMQLWMYASPIVYPAGETTGWIQRLLWWNPVTAPVELIRAGFFGGSVPGTALLWSTAVSITALLLGIFLFTRAESTFLDTV